MLMMFHLNVDVVCYLTCVQKFQMLMVWALKPFPKP